MILSVHLAEPARRASLAVMQAHPERSGAPGLVWAQTAVTVPLAAGLLPPPRPTGVGLVAAWADDAGVDHFLAHDPLAEQLADGWHVRLEPLRTFGGWSAMPGLAEITRPVDDDEPVAVLTLGRLRLRRAAAFFPTSRAAERQAVADPSVLLSTALVRPPRLIATFSVWRTAGAMRAYAYGADGAHVRASRAHHTRPFHHESVFARFRPYDAQGAWHGFSALAAERNHNAAVAADENPRPASVSAGGGDDV